MMRSPFRKVLLWVVPCALLAPEPRAAADIIPNCVDSARMVTVAPMDIDIDGDGKPEKVEIFRNGNNQRFSLLARWNPRPKGRRRDAVWAVATQIVVKLRFESSPDQIWQSHEDFVSRKDLEFLPSSEQTFLVRLSPDQEGFQKHGTHAALLKSLAGLRKDDRVAWAEPDYLLFPDREPNDDLFKNRARFRFAFVKVKALAAWDKQTGSGTVKVAVLDTGISKNHDDLGDNVIAGRNIIAGDPDANDDHGHGNYCAGLIGAESNNNDGMAGMNWKVSLMPVKFIDKDECGTSTQAAEAVLFAANNGAAVISASWGGLGYSTALRDAISGAGCKGILFVASAGNTALDLDKNSYFPATYALDNMIVAGASDDDDNRFSTGFGKFNVHLSAPGESISSADLPSSYTDGNGTSAAVALVAGAAALVKAETPDISLNDLRCRLLKATDAISTLTGASCSGGRLNVEKAVKGTGLRSVCGCP
jgi:subtilisin family serine protease